MIALPIGLALRTRFFPSSSFTLGAAHTLMSRNQLPYACGRFLVGELPAIRGEFLIVMGTQPEQLSRAGYFELKYRA